MDPGCDYYDWGAFAGVDYKIIGTSAKSAAPAQWKGEQIVFLTRAGSVKNQRTDKDALPRFLGADLEVNSRSGKRREPQESADYLEAAAQWLTSSNNRLFARVQANRIWYQLLGRGLVDPPDDFRATNPASHPALLEALATDLVKHNFDLRYLIRLIMNSRTYQLASEPNETNQSDEANFHALVRLECGTITDSQSQVAGVP
jgi:hypothetical protein